MRNEPETEGTGKPQLSGRSKDGRSWVDLRDEGSWRSGDISGSESLLSDEGEWQGDMGESGGGAKTDGGADSSVSTAGDELATVVRASNNDVLAETLRSLESESEPTEGDEGRDGGRDETDETEELEEERAERVERRGLGDGDGSESAALDGEAGAEAVAATGAVNGRPSAWMRARSSRRKLRWTFHGMALRRWILGLRLRRLLVALAVGFSSRAAQHSQLGHGWWRTVASAVDK